MRKAAISNLERDVFYKKLDEFMFDRKWSKFSIDGREFYSKSKELIEKSKDKAFFLSKSAKKRKLNFDEFLKNFKEFFYDKRYILDSKNDICLNEKGDTFLRGAAIQYFQDVFFNKNPPKNESFLLIQPVIRTQYMKEIKEGYLSSFVNIATAQINPSINEHLNHLDNWMEILSKSGFYMGDVLISKIPPERYALGKNGLWSKTEGLSIGLNYLGLDIGDAGFIKFPLKDKDIWISDIGFGLERISWAYYRDRPFFELITPKKELKHSRYELVDSIRSLTLLSMSNIRNSSIDAKNQFNKYLKNISEYDGLFDAFNLVSCFYDYWSKFINPLNSKQETYSYINNSLEKTNAL